FRSVRNEFNTKKCGQDRNTIGHHQFAIIFRNADHKSDRNKSREIEKTFSCARTFYNTYHDQVKINSQNKKNPCKLEFMPVVGINTRHENNGSDHIYQTTQ